MPTPNESVVRAVLEKDDRDILCRRAIETAWQRVLEKYPERGWWRRKSTVAGVMWEESVNNSITFLENDSGLVVIPHEDTTSFIFDDTVFLRLKRATIALISRNYPTPLATLFHRHQTDLFGFEGHHRVEIVHVFDRFLSRLDWIGVVAREKGKILWEFELRKGGAPVSAPAPAERPAPAADAVLRPTGVIGEEKKNENKR